ncbi:MAG: hypothetical protein M9894_09400 [Planctomycetes bacterium]|nr:hypothetical protein [Planctomycetota bacterium]
MPRPLDRLRRLRPLDRAALLGLLVIALAGPSLAERAALILDPALCVALAWERGGGGEPVRVVYTPTRRVPYNDMQCDLPPPPGPLPLDPWGRPFAWADFEYGYYSGPVLNLRPAGWPLTHRQGHQAKSLGQAPSDPENSSPIWVRRLDDWPRWQRTLAAHPALAALLAAAWLIVAWALLRLRPLRTRAREVALACVAALPAVPVAWLVATSDAATRLTANLPLLLPAGLAVALTIVAPCLLLALGVRLASRPEGAR